MKRYRLIQCLVFVSLGSGCMSQIRDDFDDSRVSWFNYNLAKAAYRETSDLYCNVDCPFSFKQGFIAGFVAMLNGANGCPPVFPPGTRICSTAWLDDGTPDDRRNAWYDGYSHGVLAAQQTGTVDINRIPARLPRVQQYDADSFGGTTDLSPPSQPRRLVPSLNPSSVPETDDDAPALPPTPGKAY